MPTIPAVVGCTLIKKKSCHVLEYDLSVFFRGEQFASNYLGINYNH